MPDAAGTIMGSGQPGDADTRQGQSPLASAGSEVPEDGIWPPEDYLAQIARLRASIGKAIYLAESRLPETPDGIRMTDTPVELVGVADFPRPDPARGILPHLVLLGDGRGVNLGRIARISVNRAFRPHPEEILYREPLLLRQALFGERRLSERSIELRSKALLAQLLGRPPSGSLPEPESEAG